MHQHAYLCMHSAILLRQIRPSVRLSVTPLVLCRNECTYRQTLSTVYQGMTFSFLSAAALTKFQGELPPSVETLNTLEVGIICDFRQKSPIEPTQKGVTPLPLRNNSGRRKGDAQCVFKRSVCLCISAGWRQDGPVKFCTKICILRRQLANTV